MSFDEIINSDFNKINKEREHNHNYFYVLKNEQLVAVVTDNAFDAWSTVESMKMKWNNEKNEDIKILTAYEYNRKA